MTAFLSYSRKDHEIALRLARELKSAGVLIWVDQLDIPVGVAWDSSVEAALRQSDSFLLLLSKSSVASANVLDELSYALDKTKRIVPVLIEPCEKPFRISRLQHIDLTTDFSSALARICEALGATDSGAKNFASAVIDTSRVKSKPPAVRATSRNQAKLAPKAKGIAKPYVSASKAKEAGSSTTSVPSPSDKQPEPARIETIATAEKPKANKDSLASELFSILLVSAVVSGLCWYIGGFRASATAFCTSLVCFAFTLAHKHDLLGIGKTLIGLLAAIGGGILLYYEVFK